MFDGGNVIAEYDHDNFLLRKYIYGPGVDEPVCMIDVVDNDAEYYYHRDGLGSVVALSDSNGDTVQTYEYSIYGQVAASDPNFLTNPYLFTGRRFDIETGLYYYRARYYNPYIGRFLQTDPIGYEDNLNMYAYCLNSPINLNSPISAIGPSGFIIGIDPIFMAKIVVRVGNYLIRRALAAAGIDGQRLEGWQEALTLFSMWVNETTDEVIMGPDYAFVRELMNTAPINVARADFNAVNAGKPLSEWQEVLSDDYRFGPMEFIAAGTNPALHFLGQFAVTITPRTTDDGEDTITVTNTVSWESYWRFLDKFGSPLQYGLIYSFKMIDDMETTITWTEQVIPPPWPPTEPDDKENVQ